MSDKKVIIVTGGTKGIGRAIVDLFSDQDYQVFTCARNDTGDFKSNNIHFYKADLSKKTEVQSFCEFVISHTKHVDILINNTGVFIPGKLMDEADGVFETSIDTNLSSTYHMTRGLISLIKKSRKPYIFNICSTASITAYVNGGSYCISKFAQLGFTKVLRQELKEDGIKVSAVLPGATLTNSWLGTDLPPERFSDPKSVASLINAAYQLSDTTVLEELVIRPLSGDI
jgi:NAD(P)-dependent dehydrogenase (short-subunit alcohol dehydrogenase family)